jgi:GH35 family endo-1,4-beta-xylanase/PKD repeat protein
VHSTSRYRLSWPTWLLALLLGALALAATVGGSGTAAPPPASAQAHHSLVAGDFPISGEDKFLGSVNLFSDPMFTHFFNQVTPENAGKWGSAAGLTQTEPMRWANLDAIYDFAADNSFPLNFHVLVWGNQQPTWMASLPPDEQLLEIDQWFAAVAERYPDIDWIQVVNEPLHDPPDCEHPMNQGASCPSSGDYLQALGGHNDTDGTGWDWVLNAFRLAREHFGPDAKLMINDYSITNSTAATTQYLEIIEILQSEDLIDAIGVQGHAFSTGGDMAVHEANLDRLAATGLPIQVSELDIDGLAAGGVPGDEVQLADYRRIFPTFWEHPAVEGITLWGWREPNHWRNAQNAPIVLSTGVFKPAAHWLLSYVNAIAPVITPGQAFTVDDGEVVGTVEAEDWASQIGRPELRTFTWQITGGTGAGIFAIESSTGEIRVANSELLDRKASPYSLKVRVSDGFHTSDEADVTISLPNAPPAIDAIAGDPLTGEAPLQVSFAAEASDADGDVLAYSWDFGDGATADQQSPTHVYEDPGSYLAELIVSDGEYEASDSVTVTVEPPVVEAAVDLGVFPSVRRVGKKRKRVNYRAQVVSTGTGPTGEIRVCAAARRARLGIVGARCRAVASLASGGREAEAFRFRIRRRARGKRTPIRFVARGPEIATQRAAARLIVRR